MPTKNSIFVLFARAFFTSVHFAAVLVLSTTWNNLFCSCVYNVTTCRCSIHSLWFFFFFTLLLFASLLFVNLVFLFVWHLVVCTHWKANTNFKTNLSVLEIQPLWTLLTNCSCPPAPNNSFTNEPSIVLSDWRFNNLIGNHLIMWWTSPRWSKRQSLANT